MTECQVCGGRSQLFLCRSHIGELSEMLTGLVSGGTVTVTLPDGEQITRTTAGLAQHLQEAAVGQARHGDGGVRRTGRRDTHLQGESSLASHIEAFPNEDEPDLDKGRRQRQRAALAHALAQGGVNARAGDVLVKLRRKLAEWAEDVTAATGVRFNPLDGSDLAATAAWVAHNATALANLERAGRIHGDLQRLIEQIENAINRPAQNRACGPCPTLVGAHGKQCGHALSAARDDVQVICPWCGEQYNVTELHDRLLNQTYYLTFTVDELLRLLPLGEENVPRRTLYDWIAKGKLRSRGDDALTGKPKYLMADVRRLRAQKPKRKVRA